MCGCGTGRPRAFCPLDLKTYGSFVAETYVACDGWEIIRLPQSTSGSMGTGSGAPRLGFQGFTAKPQSSMQPPGPGAAFGSRPATSASVGAPSRSEPQTLTLCLRLDDANTGGVGHMTCVCRRCHVARIWYSSVLIRSTRPHTRMLLKRLGVRSGSPRSREVSRKVGVDSALEQHGVKGGSQRQNAFMGVEHFCYQQARRGTTRRSLGPGPPRVQLLRSFEAAVGCRSRGR